jgi:hypothetical protein
VARKKLTPAQREYNKNRRRIKQAINRLEKRGYIVPENILPKIPKRITNASVRRLEKINLDFIYKKSRFVDVTTGELFEGIQGKEREKQLKKENREPDYVIFERQVLANFEREMTEVFGRNERLFNYITRWYRQSLARYGEEDFARALEEANSRGMFPSWESVSNDELLVGKLSDILDLVGGSKGGREEIMEELEYMEDWSLPE